MSSTGTASVSPVPSVYEGPHSAHMTSRTRNMSTGSGRPRPRGVRTNIACKACQKRKTKCSGGPAPCELCTKFNTNCHFNPKLDTRRKVSYKSNEKHDIRGYILESTLQVLKRGKTESVQELLRIIRSDAPIEDIARSFQQNFKSLQHKGFIPHFKIDESDIISLALQSLFPYRVGCVQGDVESDNETIYVPNSSPSHPPPAYEYTTTADTYAHVRPHSQRPHRIVLDTTGNTLRRSPISDTHTRANTTSQNPNTSFTSTTAYSSSYGDDTSPYDAYPPTPSPPFFDTVAVNQPHHSQQSHGLTPYTTPNQMHHHPGGPLDHQYAPSVILPSQPLVDKPHIQQNPHMSNWHYSGIPMGSSTAMWHGNPHVSVPATQGGMNVHHLVPQHHPESIYSSGWST